MTPLDFDRMLLRLSSTQFEIPTKLICSMELCGCLPKGWRRSAEPMSRKGFLLPIFGSIFVYPWKFWILRHVGSLMFEWSFKELCACLAQNDEPNVWRKMCLQNNKCLPTMLLAQRESATVQALRWLHLQRRFTSARSVFGQPAVACVSENSYVPENDGDCFGLLFCQQTGTLRFNVL